MVTLVNKGIRTGSEIRALVKAITVYYCYIGMVQKEKVAKNYSFGLLMGPRYRENVGLEKEE